MTHLVTWQQYFYFQLCTHTHLYVILLSLQFLKNLIKFPFSRNANRYCVCGLHALSIACKLQDFRVSTIYSHGARTAYFFQASFRADILCFTMCLHLFGTKLTWKYSGNHIILFKTVQIQSMVFNVTATIFHLYCGSQFYWWWKPEYPENNYRPVARHLALNGVRTHNLSNDSP